MNTTDQTKSQPIGLPPEQFAAAFPFHFALNLDLQFLQAGSTLRRLCPDIQLGARLDQAFTAVRPRGQISLAWVQKNREQFFLLEHRTTKLLLRGEFMPLPGKDMVLFLGSPWITDSQEIVTLGLNLGDFAIHDPVADMLQVFQANKIALEDAKKLAAKLTTQREELRDANERLRQQERETRKLALIAEHTDNAVVLTDPNGKVVWVNAGFTRLTGYTLGEILGKKPGSILQGPETNPATIQYIREQLRKGEGFTAEILNYSKTGRKYWLASQVQPIRNEAGDIINFMAIQSDITDRTNAERQLRSTNTLQRAMLQGAGYAIISTDPAGIIQLFNPAAERILGYTAAELVNQQTPGLFHDKAEVIARAAELTLELGREIKPGFETFVAKAELGQPDEREWTYIRKDGSRCPVLLSVTALFDNFGKITGYLGVASDLTVRKRDEEKFRATLSELERFNRLMLNREQRVMELKEEVNKLCVELGRPVAFKSVTTDHPDLPRSAKAT